MTNQLEMHIDPTGLLSLFLDGKMVSSFIPVLNLSGPQPDFTSAVQKSKTQVSINQVYLASKLSVHWLLTQSGNEILFQVEVSNFGTVASDPISFFPVKVFFSQVPTGSMNAWHWTYLVARGLDLYWPSYMTPMGCVTASDGSFGISAYLPLESQYLIQGDFNNNLLPNPLTLEVFTVKKVAPGDTALLRLSLKVTKDQSHAGLLGGYKKTIHPLKYQPIPQDVSAFQSMDSVHVTDTDPYGYNGDVRRIDTLEGVKAFCNWQIPFLKQKGMLGMIFWAPGGYWPTSMYPIDYDVNLARIATTWPLLVSTFKAAGLRLGIAARIGEALNSDGSGRQADPQNPADVALLKQRLDACAKTGIDLWYIDSAGTNLPSTQMIEIARQHLGPAHLFYTEFTNDRVMSSAGVYCEWMGQSTLWFGESIRAQLNYLFDSKPNWLCHDRSPAPGADLHALGFQKLYEDYDANSSG